ncbi:hypothetical protein NDU88_006926 [Pleurodeles waltl]|uniref:Uncharacterized protein n=1 Tax=Pleurodeles waltl TaxID=8319 RepID=A0AAV7UMG6_PLEWA|nr:hypothetical protein NDU88_006926 [Pleurodeles waltl]
MLRGPATRFVSPVGRDAGLCGAGLTVSDDVGLKAFPGSVLAVWCRVRQRLGGRSPVGSEARRLGARRCVAAASAARPAVYIGRSLAAGGAHKAAALCQVLTCVTGLEHDAAAPGSRVRAGSSILLPVPFRTVCDSS